MISYYIDDFGTLHIYKDNRIVADVQGCENMSEYQIDNIIAEVLKDLALI